MPFGPVSLSTTHVPTRQQKQASPSGVGRNLEALCITIHSLFKLKGTTGSGLWPL